MVKTILYTSNPDFVPRNLDQVENFADERGKYYVCYANEGTQVGDLQRGAHVVTSKGNNVYVLEVTDGSIEHEYAKKCNITGILSVDYPFCDSKPILNKQSTKTMTKNSIKGISARIKEMFMPSEAKDVRIATDGNICVATTQGYVAIDKNNCLTSYPEELTLDLPVFIISKPKEQLALNDVIATNGGYVKVTRINDNKISGIKYTGSGTTIHTIKDYVMNQTMVRVVVSLAGNLGGQMNPVLLFALSDKEDKDSLLPLLLMNQNGSSLKMNPMMLLMANKDLSTKDILLLSTMNGGFKFSPDPEIED